MIMESLDLSSYSAVSHLGKETFSDMLVNITRVAVPAIVAMMFALLVEIINISVVGHLGNTAKVAGVGLGNLYLNMFSQSIFTGLNGAIATLVS